MTAMDVLIMVALVVWIAVGLGLLVAFIRGYPLLSRFDRSLRALDAVLEILDRHLEPILHRLDRISDDVQDMTVSLRSDVETISDTVERGSRSADRVIERIERRASEVDGLLETVQEEVEESFLAVASLLRGLRGLRDRLGLGRGGRRETRGEAEEERRRSG